jgi:hypothetical protein
LISKSLNQYPFLETLEANKCFFAHKFFHLKYSHGKTQLEYYLQQLYRIKDITQQTIEYNEELIKKMNILLAD